VIAAPITIRFPSAVRRLPSGRGSSAVSSRTARRSAHNSDHALEHRPTYSRKRRTPTTALTGQLSASVRRRLRAAGGRLRGRDGSAVDAGGDPVEFVEGGVGDEAADDLADKAPTRSPTSARTIVSKGSTGAATTRSFHPGDVRGRRRRL
jgi:hypothetical protein